MELPATSRPLVRDGSVHAGAARHRDNLHLWHGGVVVHPAGSLGGGPAHQARMGGNQDHPDRLHRPVHVPVLLPHRLRHFRRRVRPDAATAQVDLGHLAGLYPRGGPAVAHRLRPVARGRLPCPHQGRQLGGQRQPLRLRSAARHRLPVLPRLDGALVVAAGGLRARHGRPRAAHPPVGLAQRVPGDEPPELAHRVGRLCQHW